MTKYAVKTNIRCNFVDVINKTKRKMTKQEFYKKHREFSENVNTQDVLTRIAGAISNLHWEIGFHSPQEIDETLNGIKEYIFDYKDLLKAEEKK